MFLTPFLWFCILYNGNNNRYLFVNPGGGGGDEGGNCSRRCSLYFSLKFKFDNPFSGAVFIRMIITHVIVCVGGGWGGGGV